jgi:hypothetical protein
MLMVVTPLAELPAEVGKETRGFWAIFSLLIALDTIPEDARFCRIPLL